MNARYSLEIDQYVNHQLLTVCIPPKVCPIICQCESQRQRRHQGSRSPSQWWTLMLVLGCQVCSWWGLSQSDWIWGSFGTWLLLHRTLTIPVKNNTARIYKFWFLQPFFGLINRDLFYVYLFFVMPSVPTSQFCENESTNGRSQRFLMQRKQKYRLLSGFHSATRFSLYVKQHQWWIGKKSKMWNTP